MVQPPQTPDEKPDRKRQFSILRYIVIVFVGGFFLLQLLNSQFSTLSIILFGTIVALLVIFLVLGIKRHGRTKLFGKIVTGFTVAVIVFGAVGYFSQFYGPTVPQVGDSNILNTPLTSHLQTLQQSAGYQFINAAHFGTLTFEDLTMHSTFSNAPQGGVDWNFHAGDTKSRLMIGQTSGKPYYYSSTSYSKGHPLPDYYPSDEQTTKVFSQIDSLGLNWFYEQAVSQYQNATGNKPASTALTLYVGYDSVEGYSGIVLSITGKRESLDNYGAKVYPLIFEVEFQPNGTIIHATNLPS